MIIVPRSIHFKEVEYKIGAFNAIPLLEDFLDRVLLENRNIQ